MQQPGRSAPRRLVHIGLVCVTVVVVPSTAGAQTAPKLTSPKQVSPRPTGPRWEISFHGGIVTRATAEGESQTPVPGPTFVMADGTTPTQAVSSWYFGDGANLLNQVLQLRGLTARMSPLDHLPGWPAPSRGGGQVGARIARHLDGGFWFEGAVDFGLGALGFNDAARDRIDAARRDFETAFTALAASASAVMTTSTVTAAANIDSGGPEILASGILQYRGRGARIRPIVLGGLGVASRVGRAATLTMTGTYRFTTPTQAVIEETDTMRLRYEPSNSVVWIFGGGMMHDLSRSSAYRIDVRVLASSTQLKAFLDAAPSRTTGSPGGVIVLNATSPGLQFSSSTTINPSLSRTQNEFEAFTSEGRAFQLALSASYVRKF